MEIVKFKEEINTLKKFFEVYCKEKDVDQKIITKTLNYKNEEIKIELNLCPECLRKINYSFDRLLECPHDIKPRCRTCPTPCYEKKQWKEAAKIMRYSGMRLGLLSLNKKIKNIFKRN
ncbi:nitrous oxide-stimulated promoter family protein [Arcobacter sp. LA11]|uniref:nitrous oxide-stimulated promoter family protein n=1 Tax=Arcobacter sp. LA11 TaxID=1898176 RepID=UPI000932798A|nr:nitrous oxide-stimulated promoter family protein [Arcobacter sp. LA11]